MSQRRRKLSDQVIVITGATSGIGLTTARLAAARGARLVLGARNDVALLLLANELSGHGGGVEILELDVADSSAMDRLGQTAIARFGRIDTWINNAGASIYGRNEDILLADQHRLFQTNFWGVVNGSLTALRHMKASGGTLINLGSELSDRAVPLQGVYSASKHAVKAYTESLRMELEKDGSPLSVTLIKPAAIDTPFTLHAKNYMDKEPALPPPLYAPEVAAKAILYTAEHAQRDVYVGAASRLMSSLAFYMPRLLDHYMKGTMFGQQKRADDVQPLRTDALYQPNGSELLQNSGGRNGKALRHAPYTALAQRSKPLTIAALLGTAALAVWAVSSRAATVPAQEPGR